MAGSGAINNPAAYGSKPAPVTPQVMAGTDVPAAIGAGTQVYSQLPGYSQDIANIGTNITAETAGQLPQDVITEIQQQAAQSGATTGGSNAAYLKALGLTSLGLESTGLSNLETTLQGLPGAAEANNPNIYPTTGQALDAAQQNSVWAAAPDPLAAAQAGLAATGAGYGAGAGSVGGRLPATPTVAAGAPPPEVMLQGGDGGDSGNAAGSPGALTNWTSWYKSINPSAGVPDTSDTMGE